MVSKQSTKDLTLRGWSLLNVVLLVYNVYLVFIFETNVQLIL